MDESLLTGESVETGAQSPGGTGGGVSSVGGTAPVVSSGGATPNISINPATTAAAGSMSAADKLIVDGLAFLDAQIVAQANFMKAQVPALTRCRWFRPGENSVGVIATGGPGVPAAVTGDKGVNGGAVTSGANQYHTYGVTILQNPKIVPWAISFYGRLPPGTSGHTSELGLVDVGGGNFISIAGSFAVGAGAHYQLEMYNGAGANTDGTIANDGLPHWFTLSFDLTAVKIFIDQVLNVSKTSLTNMPTVPMMLESWNQAAGEAWCSDIIYAW